MEITVKRLFEDFAPVVEWAETFKGCGRYFTPKPSDNDNGWWAGRSDDYNNLVLVEITSDEVPSSTVKNWVTGEIEHRPEWF